MSKRQLLIPAASFERVEQRLSVFSSEIDAILWSSNGLTAPDGSSIEPSEFKPEIGWIPTVSYTHLTLPTILLV